MRGKGLALGLAAALMMAGCAQPPSALEISVIKAGKADAIIICVGGEAALIDAGEDDDGDKVLEEARRLGINRFEYMILTHYDKDHVGGAAEVLASIRVGQVLEPGYAKSSKEYAAFSAMAGRVGVPRSVPEDGFCFELSGATVEVLMPQKSEYENENDYSIAVKVSYAGHSALFAGDALDERTAELMQQDIAADILKVPHHGSFESGSEDFFAAVMPEYAVITCSEKNPADERVVAALEGLGCTVLTTANGTVRLAASQAGVELLP